jgi:hypothetical protein
MLLTRIVVTVTDTCGAEGDGANGLSTSGESGSVFESGDVEERAGVVEVDDDVSGSNTGIIHMRAVLSLRLPTVYERP